VIITSTPAKLNGRATVSFFNHAIVGVFQKFAA
jgi:hypothetical protein